MRKIITRVRSADNEIPNFVIQIRSVRQVSGLNPCLLSISINNTITSTVNLRATAFLEATTPGMLFIDDFGYGIF